MDPQSQSPGLPLPRPLQHIHTHTRTRTQHHPHLQAWIGNTSVYLFISFNTLLYLLHCLEAGEIDQYLIFRAQEWRGISASATLRKSSPAHRLRSHIFSHPHPSLMQSHSHSPLILASPRLFSSFFLNHLFVRISVRIKKTTRL